MLALATIGLIGWIALTVLQICANLYLLRFRIDVDDNLMARKHVTQVRVLVRALDTVIVLLTLGFALMTFDSVRQFGVSLFASAGVAGVVFGLAAQPVLSNLIAGVQLARDAADPARRRRHRAERIRLDRRDQRHLCRDPAVGSAAADRAAEFFHPAAVLQLDAAGDGEYRLGRCSISTIRAPIDRIRDKTAEFVTQSKIDGKVVNVQVTNTSAQAIEVRALLTALTTPPTPPISAPRSARN